MKTTATLLALGALVALAPQASAQCTGTPGTDFQRVTLDEVNALTSDQIAALNAGGADLDESTIQDNVISAFNNQTIEFTAVILTNPNLSGLASPSGGGAPNRHHVFVRDTAFDTEGAAGMGGQLVDSNGLVFNFGVGDEVTICGDVAYFGTTLQIAPQSMSLVDTRDADDPILDPVVITTDVIHDTFDVNGEPRSQVDWDVFGDYLYQYVRFETIELVQGIPGDRPNMLFSTSGEDTSVRTDNFSVCYDNRRQAESYYAPRAVPACVTDGEFVPPATGIVNVQGFLVLRSGFDAFDSAVPGIGAFSITPFTPEDFEIAVAPPIITAEDTPIPSPSAGAAIRLTVVPGTTGNTVASVVADYTTSSGGSGRVTLSNTSGDVYEGTIAGLSADEFVTYTVTATDNENASATTSAVTRRVIDGPVSSITDVQVTPSGGPGPSSILTSEAVPFDLDAVVQTAYISSSNRYQVTIQDDPDLGGFTGVLVDFGSTDPGLAVGDRINISAARVSEFRDATQLSSVEFTVTGQGDPYPAKVVTTDLFNGALGDETAEQHEGMLLRFEDVEITSTNPDEGSGDFGEWAFSSDGTADNALRADDASSAFESDFNSSLTVGQALASIEGYLSYSFGNYKLIPTEASDVQFAVSAEGGLEGASLRVLGSYPNPAAAAVRVRFELDAPGVATLALYDVTGRQVAALADGPFAAAAHDVTADLGALAAGVYVLRLESGGEVATARLAIVR